MCCEKCPHRDNLVGVCAKQFKVAGYRGASGEEKTVIYYRPGHKKIRKFSGSSGNYRLYFDSKYKCRKLEREIIAIGTVPLIITSFCLIGYDMQVSAFTYCLIIL